MTKKTNDWNPGTYAKFRGFRLRPAIDLLTQIDDLPAGDIIDLGCGNGAVGPALSARFAGRRLIGVDSSPAMLAEAEKTGAYDQLIQADATVWAPKRQPALIFSNALCHWLGDHASLFPHLLAMVRSGGALAVQMPRQFGAPSHALLRQIAQSEFPDIFDFSNWRAPVGDPVSLAGMLEGAGDLNIWETEYFQRLEPESTGHPVRHFTGSTAMRPFLEKLDDTQAALFQARYDQALALAYPTDDAGGVLFAFRRVFFVLRR